MNKTRKPGSGRTTGSFTFSECTLAELNRILRPEATVIISRKFAEAIKLRGIPVAAKPELYAKTEKVDFSLTTA